MLYIDVTTSADLHAQYTSKAVKVEPYVGTLNDVMARVEPTMQKVAVRD